MTTRIYNDPLSVGSFRRDRLNFDASMLDGVLSGLNLVPGSTNLLVTLTAGSWARGGILVEEDAQKADVFDLAGSGDRHYLFYAYLYNLDGTDPLLDYLITNLIDPNSVGYVSGEPYYSFLEGTVAAPPTLEESLALLGAQVPEYAIKIGEAIVPNGAVAITDAGVRLTTPDLASPEDVKPRIQHTIDAFTFSNTADTLLLRWVDWFVTAPSPYALANEQGMSNVVAMRVRSSVAAVDTTPNDYDYQVEKDLTGAGSALIYCRALKLDPTDPANVSPNYLESDSRIDGPLPTGEENLQLEIYPMAADLTGVTVTDDDFHKLAGDSALFAGSGWDGYPTRPDFESIIPLGVARKIDGTWSIHLMNGVHVTEGSHYANGLMGDYVHTLSSTVYGTSVQTNGQGVLDIDGVITNISDLATLSLDAAYNNGRNITADEGPITIDAQPGTEAAPDNAWMPGLQIQLASDNLEDGRDIEAGIDVYDGSDATVLSQAVDPDRLALRGRYVHCVQPNIGNFTAYKNLSTNISDVAGEVVIDVDGALGSVGFLSNYQANNLEGILFATIVHSNGTLDCNDRIYKVEYNNGASHFHLVHPTVAGDVRDDFGGAGFGASSQSVTIWEVYAQIKPSTVIADLNARKFISPNVQLGDTPGFSFADDEAAVGTKLNFGDSYLETTTQFDGAGARAIRHELSVGGAPLFETGFVHVNTLSFKNSSRDIVSQLAESTPNVAEVKLHTATATDPSEHMGASYDGYVVRRNRATVAPHLSSSLMKNNETLYLDNLSKVSGLLTYTGSGGSLASVVLSGAYNCQNVATFGGHWHTVDVQEFDHVRGIVVTGHSSTPEAVDIDDQPQVWNIQSFYDNTNQKIYFRVRWKTGTGAYADARDSMPPGTSDLFLSFEMK